MHWAHSLIGRPWTPEENCWALVRQFFKTRFDIDMPEEASGVLALTEAAHKSGWRPVDGIGEVDDIVLMRNALGARHVGVLIHANGKIGVLHADGHMTNDGPVGCVGFNTMHDLARTGMRSFEFWRRA